ncbi:hypothetical protein VCUG_01023 [Vavraia culicis subsp. floridensis]|uniref:Uncharacterized protein n=1 Tax=Vavraia culicis (isolate floridensis) TaxID=948595 RepID=L2GV02_VAVCU|nr:uncharacterized protein VCUG_01023 [Vavraia culicis subsp. floridensis]ELA47491.1 hypothetical protein VCUG_01023 [Vavraia culicis subsp. floridensis]
MTRTSGTTTIKYLSFYSVHASHESIFCVLFRTMPVCTRILQLVGVCQSSKFKFSSSTETVPSMLVQGTKSCSFPVLEMTVIAVTQKQPIDTNIATQRSLISHT